MRGKRWSEETRRKVIYLYERGCTLADIEELTYVPMSTAHGWIKSYRVYGTGRKEAVADDPRM